jgi:hypothetical protein
VLDFTKEFGVSVALIEAACEQQDLAPVVAALHEVVRQRALAVSFLNSDKIVRAILGLAVATDDVVTAVEAFEVVEHVLLRDPIGPERQAIIDELYDRHRPKFDRPPDGQTAFPLAIFRRAPSALLARILDLPANTFLSRAILAAFQAMTETDRESVASDLGLARRIMDVLPKTVANGCLTDLAWLLVCRDCPEFAQFRETVVKPRIDSRTVFIGAHDEQEPSVEAELPDIVFRPSDPDAEEENYDSDEDDEPDDKPVVRVVMPPVPDVPPPDEEDVVGVALPVIPDVPPEPPDEEEVLTVVAPNIPDVEPPEPTDEDQ